MSKDGQIGHIGQASLDPDFLQGTIWACGWSEPARFREFIARSPFFGHESQLSCRFRSEHIISSNQASFYSSRDKRNVIKIARDFLHWLHSFIIFKGQ